MSLLPTDGAMSAIRHVHETVPAPATCNAKLEKNSRGMNYECTVVGARTPAEADALLRDLRSRMEAIVNGEVSPEESVASADAGRGELPGVVETDPEGT
jgi:hypothetical protein